VVLSLSQAPPLWHETGTVAFGGPAFNATLGPYNVHYTASLIVKSTGNTETATPVHFCLVYAKYGLPQPAHYNADNCFFYFNSTAGSGTTTVNVALRDVAYMIGVFFSSPNNKKGDNSTLEVTLEGADCGVTSYWNGQACQAAAPITLNEVVTADLKKGETKYWTYNAPNYVGTLRFSSTDGSDISAVNSVIWARYSAVPSADIHDAIDSDGNVTVVSARPGLWVFAVHAAETATGSFRLTGQICGPNSGGVGCMIHVANITDNPAAVLQQTPLYFKINAITKYPLVVSITTNNGSNIPYFYVSRGVIPTKGTDSADVPNCNGGYCDVVRAVKFNVTEEGEYFVGVFPSLTIDSGNQTFGIWWNSTCVSGCEHDNHGTCQDSGRCACEIDFDGIDCSVSLGLGPQYIVLIIIASLVVASAIIGFVAWAYMRRKRAAYEIVS